MTTFTINRKKLNDEIWDISARKVAEKYGISYTRLLAKCKECDIPIPPSGYFTKRQFGKPVEQTLLPKSNIEDVVIESPDASKIDSEPSAIPVTKATEENATDNRVQGKSTTNTSESEATPGVPLDRYVDPDQALREELFQKVWERPMSELAKEYKISDVALHKRCAKLEVPVPPRGYWAKLKAGKPVDRPRSLPVMQKAAPPKPKTGDMHALHIEQNALSFMQEDDRREILELAAKLEVGGHHTKMLDSIQEMEDKCREWHKKGPYGGYPARNGRYASEPFLANTIPPKSFSRAFHIIDALVKALQPYKGSINSDIFSLQLSSISVDHHRFHRLNHLNIQLAGDARIIIRRYRNSRLSLVRREQRNFIRIGLAGQITVSIHDLCIYLDDIIICADRGNRGTQTSGLTLTKSPS